MDAAAPFEVRPSRGPRLRRVPGHEGDYFSVFDTRTEQQVGQYVREENAVEYAAQRNAAAASGDESSFFTPA